MGNDGKCLQNTGCLIYIYNVTVFLSRVNRFSTPGAEKADAFFAYGAHGRIITVEYSVGGAVDEVVGYRL